MKKLFSGIALAVTMIVGMIALSAMNVFADTPAIEYIEVTSEPYKNEYYVGDGEDAIYLYGIEVTVYYDNSDSDCIGSDDLGIAGYDFSNGSGNLSGWISVSYQGCTAQFDVSLTYDPSFSAEVTSEPYKTDYYVGDDEDDINLDRIEVTVTYDNGCVRSFGVDELEIDSFDFSNDRGDFCGSITVRHEDITAEFDVWLSYAGVYSIDVTKPPKKTSYCVGDSKEAIDLDGIEVFVLYDNLYSRTIDAGEDGLYIDSFDFTSDQYNGTVTVGLESQTDDFDVDLDYDTVDSVEITRAPDKTSYSIGDDGDDIDLTGIEVTVIYNNGYKRTLGAEDLTVTTTDTFTDFGEYSVGAEFDGTNFITFGIGVVFGETVSYEIADLPDKTEYYTNDGAETVDLEGISVRLINRNGCDAFLGSEDFTVVSCDFARNDGVGSIRLRADDPLYCGAEVSVPVTLLHRHAADTSGSPDSYMHSGTGNAHWLVCGAAGCDLKTVSDYEAAFEADPTLKTVFGYAEHTYDRYYGDNGDGTHSPCCECGVIDPDTELKEKHGFFDGKCLCGAVEPVPSESYGRFSYCGTRNHTSSIGTGGGIFWGIRIPAGSISGKYHQLEKVRLCENQYIGNYTLLLFSVEPGTAPADVSSPDYTQTFTTKGSLDWKTVELETPYQLPDGKDLWIVFYNDDAGYPVTCCDYVGVPDSSLISIDGANWGQIYLSGRFFSCLIKADFDTDHVHSFVDAVCDCGEVEPIPSDHDGWFSYCGSRGCVMNLNVGEEAYWGIRIPAGELKSSYTHLTKVQVYKGASDGTYKLMLFSTAHNTFPEDIGSPDYVQEFAASGAPGWVTEELDTQFALTEGEDLWIILYNNDMEYPVTCCNNTENPDSLWIFTGTGWIRSTTAGYYYSGMVKGYFEDLTPSVTGASLTLSSDLYLNFYMNLPKDAAANGTMEFTIGSRTVAADVRCNENGYYFTCPLNVLEMAETVTAVFTYDGKTCEKSYSVREYIDGILTGTDGNGKEYPETLLILARKLANYGHYAQIYLAALHSATVTIGGDGYAEMEACGETDVETARNALEDNIAVSGETDRYTLLGRTVYFDSTTVLNYYITVGEGETLASGDVVCSGAGNKKITVKEYTAKEDTFIVSVRNITALELGEKYTVTVGEGEDRLEIIGSVLDYCGAVMKTHSGDGTEKTEDEKAEDERASKAMAALYEYYQAAAEYKTYVDSLN